MLKKITEPQALYQKAGTETPVGVTPVTTTASKPSKPPKKKMNFKLIGSIAAVLIFIAVGVAGVMIAQRQQNQPGPVAPTAPESQPEAASTTPGACSLTFTVQEPVVPDGTAACQSKVAYDSAGKAYATNTTVAKGTTIEYKITVSAAKQTSGPVVVTDKLPAHLEYVANTLLVDGKTFTNAKYDAATTTFTVTLGTMAANNTAETKTISYKAKVKQTAAVGAFSNSVVVKTNNVAVTTPAACKSTLSVAAPPTGTAKCETKVAYNTTGSAYAANDLVKRGDTIIYKIKVSSEKETSGPVVVTDKLPSHVTYVANSLQVDDKAFTNAKYDAATSTITVTLGTLAVKAKETHVISYRATVKADAPVTAFSNTVVVSTNGKAATTPAACKTTLKVAPVGVAQCVDKTAFTDYSGTAIEDEATISRGQTIAYKLKIAASETTSGNVVVTDKLPESLEFVEAKTEGLTYNQSTRTLSVNLGTMGDIASNKEQILEFKVKVAADTDPGDITNTATVTTSGGNNDPCVHTVRVPYICNSSCSTDSQCQSGNQGYICSSDNGNKCRLGSNPTAEDCEQPDQAFSCNSSCQTDDQCKTANSNYKCVATSEGNRCRNKDYETQATCEAPATPTPTPTIGCNATCSTNADCTNPSHICYTTDDGSQRCRLDTNPQSSSCTNPVVTTPGQPQQPELPEELPQTGPENWVNWLKAGLVTLGIGAVLLLLL